ncbi:MAG: Gfo/Idh/MocA family oxidoreductase [Gemmatimonadaceae bacterium]
MASIATPYIDQTGSDVTTPLRIAVIGAGRMGRHHATAIQRLAPGASLVAVADERREEAQRFATEFDIPASYEDVTAMLACERPHVVHVCTSPASHAVLALAALEAGSHVYVEKPFTETGADARRLLSLARDRGLRVCAGHQLLFEGPTRTAAAMLPEIGRIQHVESYFAFRQARRQDGRTPLNAIEQLLDILPHPAYLLVHFLGGDAPNRPIVIHGLRVEESGSVHALVGCGEATGVLVATLHGRPVDSYVRIVGTRGTLLLDYIRGIVIPQIGPGSTIDKILDPYQRATALAAGSTRSLARRFLSRERSYPGLAEAFGAFYEHIATDAPPPVTNANIERTVGLCDAVRLRLQPEGPAHSEAGGVPTVAVTGGTGLLGRKVVEALVVEGITPLVVARRFPAERDRVSEAIYLIADLGEPGALELPPSIETVVHCAAETVGGWDAHQRNSIDATRHLLDAMSAARARQLIHVSSLAVIDKDARQPLSEISPLERNSRGRGAYVWGKLESERIAADAENTHGIQVRIVRPGPLIDAASFDAPGKLGRAIGPFFVAMGSPRATIPVSDVDRSARLIVWMAQNFESSPSIIHAVDSNPQTRRDLVMTLRRARPSVRVIWFPAPFLTLVSAGLVVVQKVLRPLRPAVSVKAVFDAPRCDTARLQNIVSGATADGVPAFHP